MASRAASLPYALPRAVAAAPVLAARAWADCADSASVAAWDRLAAESAEPNPFLESWYLLPSLRALDPQCSVDLLVLSEGPSWLGVLPMARATSYYRWPIPNRRNWVHANAFVGAPLVAKGFERTFWRALLAHADAHPGSALFLHLTALPLSGALFEALAAELAGRPAGLVHREERALLRSDLSPEAYLEAALSGKKRKELRRQHARLSELGDLRTTAHSGAGDVHEWTEDFLRLEQSGWKGAAGSALASAPETAALFREAIAGAAAYGRLERLTLTLGDRPIAMLATFITPPGAFSYKTAFAEEFARFSPGVLLQRENLALLAAPGIDWCDSCAAADHPMIDHLWRERRAVGRVSIGIGGTVRRTLFSRLLKAELGRRPTGLAA